MRKASVSSTERGNSALLIPVSLWFGTPFDTLMVVSMVERLTILSMVEGRSKQPQTDYVSSHTDNMIKHPEVLQKLEDDFIRDVGKLSFDSAIKLFTYMWKEAVHLGLLPPKDPLEGIQVDITIAKTLNSCLKQSSPR